MIDAYMCCHNCGGYLICLQYLFEMYGRAEHNRKKNLLVLSTRPSSGSVMLWLCSNHLCISNNILEAWTHSKPTLSDIELELCGEMAGYSVISEVYRVTNMRVGANYNVQSLCNKRPW